MSPRCHPLQTELRRLGLSIALGALSLTGGAWANEPMQPAASRPAGTVAQVGTTEQTAADRSTPDDEATGTDRAATPGTAAPLEELATFGWPDSKGEPFDVDSLKGKPVVINFWATWCAPCIKEMPDLSALSQELGSEAAFIGISLDKQDRVQRFTEKTPVAYPLLIADFKGLSLARQWGNKQGQMPYTVVLNAQGRLHWQHAGLVDVDELRSMLKSPELR